MKAAKLRALRRPPDRLLQRTDRPSRLVPAVVGLERVRTRAKLSVEQAGRRWPSLRQQLARRVHLAPRKGRLDFLYQPPGVHRWAGRDGCRAGPGLWRLPVLRLFHWLTALSACLSAMPRIDAVCGPYSTIVLPYRREDGIPDLVAE